MKKSYVRISALLVADTLVAYALFVMQNYLTEVWKLSFTHAAGILNVWNGLYLALPVFFLFLVDVLLGNFGLLVISSIAYSVGIGLVTISTPAVYAKFAGTCKQDEPKCIGHRQKALFYAGMVLIAVGKAGNHVSGQPFLQEQEEDGINQNSASYDVRKALLELFVKLPSLIVLVSVAVVGAIALPYVKPWSLRFGIPAIFTAAAMLAFLTGFCWPYGMDGRKGCPVTNRGGVFALVPMWLTFIICGMVSSIGNTYFVEQAAHLDRHLGAWNVPFPVFLLIFRTFKKFFGLCVVSGVINYFKSRGASVGIGVAMVFSILCCIIAATIEQLRLHAVRNHNLIDKPDEDIPMTVYWLLFQFFLLAGLDSFFESSVAAFFRGKQAFKNKSPNYKEYSTKGVLGLGFMSSVLSVYVVGKISETGGNPNWFQPTLNKSRLDRYYWVLAALSFVNLIAYIVVMASCSKCRNSAGDDREADRELEPQEFGDPEERQIF